MNDSAAWYATLNQPFFAPPSWVAYVNVPYLIWVSFATVLQLSITWLNR